MLFEYPLAQQHVILLLCPLGHVYNYKGLSAIFATMTANVRDCATALMALPRKAVRDGKTTHFANRQETREAEVPHLGTAYTYERKQPCSFTQEPMDTERDKSDDY